MQKQHGPRDFQAQPRLVALDVCKDQCTMPSLPATVLKWFMALRRRVHEPGVAVRRKIGVLALKERSRL